MMSDTELVARFLEGTLEPASFAHETHVRVTYLLLRDRPLPETLIALRDGLTRLATRAGHPEKYHETITFAFAAVINERMHAGTAGTWDAFAEANRDLFGWGEGSVLERFYDRATLVADAARRTFLLPRPAISR